MRAAFTDESASPPLGGGSDTVRLFAGDMLPIAAWNSHSDDLGCDHPFLWVRLARRFRTDPFPAPTLDSAPCGLPVGIVIEVGVARCAVVDMEPSWDDYAREAEVSVDDSWRVELALCRAAKTIVSDGCGINTAADIIFPIGPEGGVIAWAGNLHVQLL